MKTLIQRHAEASVGASEAVLKVQEKVIPRNAYMETGMAAAELESSWQERGPKHKYPMKVSL